MKNWSFTIIALLFLLSSCGDKSDPVFTTFTIDGESVADLATFTASFGATAEIASVVNDDDELLQFIGYIDTTGIGGTSRIFAVGLTGKETFVQHNLKMSTVDSISQANYFGGPVPIIFEVSDQQFNSAIRTVFFDVQ